MGRSPRVDTIRLIGLACGCKKEFNAPVPESGDLILCMKHGVVAVEYPKWFARCTHTGCRYSRKFGAAPITAETFAVKHSLTKSHRVRLYCSDGTERFIGGTQTFIPDGDTA